MNQWHSRAALALLAAVLVGLAAPGLHAQAPPKVDRAHGERAARVIADCMNKCAACAQHCAHLIAQGKKEHLRTMELCAGCADVCATTAKLVASHNPLTAIFSEACARACDLCGEACERAGSDEMMQACAKACRECAEHCRQLSKGGAERERVKPEAGR
jgi:hypothetical protein